MIEVKIAMTTVATMTYRAAQPRAPEEQIMPTTCERRRADHDAATTAHHHTIIKKTRQEGIL